MPGHGDLIRKIVNAFEEHQSRENAKHTHRAMLENARQGFWNGAVPPFGYSTVVKERRGNKDKKVLIVNESEASLVRTIFELAISTDGRPLGVKAIANHLNERDIQRRGRRFGTGSIHDLLTTSTYRGCHYFNQFDSRLKEKRPPSQWIEVAVPAGQDLFDRVQATLRARAPKVMAPRNVNEPTMLASVARCADCGAAMILNTGKGGAYRYYSCSKAMKQGKTACTGRRIRMDRLDKMVMAHITEGLFAPERLTILLQTFIAHANARRAGQREKLRQARDARGSADAGSGDNVEAARLRSLRDKILALVPRQQAVKLETDHEALLEAQGLAARPGPRVPIDPEIARRIAEAIKAGRVLEIIYRSRGERRARRRKLGPYGVLSGFRRYLVAAPIGSDEVEPRTYRFEAIRSARMTDEVFQRPTNFDLQRYANRAFGSYHNPAQYEEVEWRFTSRAAEYALSFRFHPEQRVERCPDGSVIVRFKASRYLEMCWHLYAWGHDVGVIAPEALRVMCEQYRRSDFSALP